MKRYWGLRGSRLNAATIVLVVMPAFLCFGYNQAVAGGVLTLESFVNTFPEMDTVNTTGAQAHHNSTIQGTVIALYTLGAMFGALSCIWLGDVLGRRRTIFLATVTSMIGAILMASSFSLGQFIVARIVVGLGTGGYTATIPVWQAEISRSSNRGAHVVTEGIFIGSGICIALWIDFGFYFIKSSSISWRFPFAFQIILNLVVLAFIFTLPESPRWLIRKDRFEEARVILAILEDCPEDAATVSRDIEQVRTSLRIAGTGSIFDLLKMGHSRILNRTLLAALCQMFQQMCGVNLITFYATTIFQVDLGLQPTEARILAASMEICQPLGGFLCYFTIDRFGRRKLMLSSATMMCICMIILAATTSQPNNSGALIAATVFLFVFNFFFPLGFLGIPFLYATEVAPLHLRAAISGISVATTWLFNFLVAEITPVGFNTIGYRYWIVYACINAAIIPTVYFLFPETMGRSLEQMDLIFEEATNFFAPVRIAKKLPQDSLMGGGSDDATKEKSPSMNSSLNNDGHADQDEHVRP